jgi:conjugal transfer mating pair stabilization protein TraG
LSRSIGDTLSAGKSLGHTETNTWGLHGGAKASAGAKIIGAEVGASGSGTWDHAWAKTTGDQESHGSSDSQSETQSANVAHYHANGQDVTLTDGGYWRDGAFHRVENFAEKRHAVERDFSRAQALERQASRSDDIGSRLEHIASMSRSNGYQISDDMSQIIASRYASMAASPEFRGLGAPSLTSTTPSPHQREVRNMIVSRILEEYAANDLGRVQRALKDPVDAMGAVRGAAPVSAPHRAAQMHTGRAHRTPLGQSSGASARDQAGAERQPHIAPGDQKARDTIGRGAADVRREDADQNRSFSKKNLEAQDRNRKIDDDVN